MATRTGKNVLVGGHGEKEPYPTLWIRMNGWGRNEESMNILITACPRSATHHIARVINTMGHSCTFEKRNLNGFTSSWKHIVSGDFETPCPETKIECKFDKIIHQVRHPLKVITSSMSLWTMSMNYISNFMDLPDPIVNRDNTLLNCMISWFEWNKIIEEKADWRYRIEDIYNIQEKWCEELEIPFQNIPQLSHSNTREHKELTWDDLYKEHYGKANIIHNMASRYGY